MKYYIQSLWWIKNSGIGREAGKLGLEEYLKVKVVSGWND